MVFFCFRICRIRYAHSLMKRIYLANFVDENALNVIIYYNYFSRIFFFIILYILVVFILLRGERSANPAYPFWQTVVWTHLSVIRFAQEIDSCHPNPFQLHKKKKTKQNRLCQYYFCFSFYPYILKSI